MSGPSGRTACGHRGGRDGVRLRGQVNNGTEGNAYLDRQRYPHALGRVYEQAKFELFQGAELMLG